MALVTSGSVNPNSVHVHEHARECSVVVPVESRSLGRVVEVMPAGVHLQLSFCDDSHVETVKRCVDECLKEVRGRFHVVSGEMEIPGERRKKKTVEATAAAAAAAAKNTNEFSADVAFTRVMSVFPW